MNTPWYYNHFDRIFSRGVDVYAHEASVINELVDVSSKRLQEVGAGTGYHVASILKYNVVSMLAIDRDVAACALLQERFASDPRVRVACCDGFRDAHLEGADLIYCMYSVMLQGLDSRASLTQRVQALLLRARDVIFEGVDVDVNRQVFPGGRPNRVYSAAEDYVDVIPSYAHQLALRFEGRIGEERIEYDVSLLAVGRVDTERLVAAAGCKVRSLPLESNRRRMLYLCSTR
jgi:hypothetical protein